MVGDEIRWIRKYKGLTQKELGALSGTSENTIRQYEKGLRQPRLEQLQKIAEALRVPIERLLLNEKSKVLVNDDMKGDLEVVNTCRELDRKLRSIDMYLWGSGVKGDYSIIFPNGSTIDVSLEEIFKLNKTTNDYLLFLVTNMKNEKNIPNFYKNDE